jgi:hypothetical protein
MLALAAVEGGEQRTHEELCRSREGHLLGGDVLLDLAVVDRGEALTRRSRSSAPRLAIVVG